MKKFFVALFIIVCFAVANPISYADNVHLEDTSYIDDGEHETEVIEENSNSIFSINKDSSREFICNGEKVTLYLADIVMDLNNDGKTNVADARIILRISVQLDEIEQDVALYDISADGEITISDARLLLRYVSMLDVYYADENALTISGWVADEDSDACYFYDNGMLASGYAVVGANYYYFGNNGKICYGEVKASGEFYYFDEKGVGFTGFKTIDSNKYYFVKGKALTGLATIDGIVYGFSETGAMLKGLNEIDGDYYFFSDAGIAQDGWITIDGNKYYFLDRKAQTGLTTIDGTVYGFSETGAMLKGLNEIDGNYYFFSDSGIAQTGWMNIDSNKYYFGSDYKAVSGNQTINGTDCVFSDSCIFYSGYAVLSENTYYYVDGSPYSGWLYDDLDAYYFYSDGKMAKNITIGNASFDSNGIASCNKLATDTLQIYLRNILKNNGTSIKSIYNYVRKNHRYKYYAESTPDAMVLRILKNKKGACYDFANLTKYLLEAAGYECYVVVGKSFNASLGSEHDWVLVKVDGVWRHMDTQKGAYLKTDAQMKNMGYKWSEQGLPAAK